jgi:hypothetical protein
MPSKAILKAVLVTILSVVSMLAHAATVTISGTIVDSSGAGLSGATITLNGHSLVDGVGYTHTATSASSGSFDLTIDNTGMPDIVALTITNSGYVPTAITVTFGTASSISFPDIPMETDNGNVFLIQLSGIARVVHLGNGAFSGTANSQFQATASHRSTYTSPFDITADHLAVSSVSISLLVKGAQINNPVKLNGNLLGYLNDSPDDGSYSLVTFSNIPWTSQGLLDTK